MLGESECKEKLSNLLAMKHGLTWGQTEMSKMKEKKKPIDSDLQTPHLQIH